MSIASLGILGGLASTPLSQRAAEADKTQQETADQSRVSRAAERAEQAAGIGQTEEDSQAGDRDADGRRLWEEPGKPQSSDSTLPSVAQATGVRAKDPSGACGGQLDLVG